MTIKHASKKGTGSIHWYTSITLSSDIVVRNMLVDTGATITTIDSKLLAMMNYMEIDSFSDLVRSTCTDVIRPTLAAENTNERHSIEMYGVIIRDVQVGGDVFPFVKVYTSLDATVSNIVGMDIIKCYDLHLRGDYASADLLDISMYNPRTKGSAEIKKVIAG